MGYKIDVTPLAMQDLDGIVDYISKALENPTAATAFLDSVDECYGALEKTPMMYEQCRDSYLKTLGYRRAVIKNYIMVYKVNAQEQTVSVLRFFYGARDYEKLL